MASPELLEFKRDSRPCMFCKEDNIRNYGIMPKGWESRRISVCEKCLDIAIRDLLWFIDTKCAEEQMKSLYPSWCQLNNKDKEIVSEIAEQVPILGVEEIASIFISQNLSFDATVDYIKEEYGFKLY